MPVSLEVPPLALAEIAEGSDLPGSRAFQAQMTVAVEQPGMQIARPQGRLDSAGQGIASGQESREGDQGLEHLASGNA
ncbi:hypothetical protein D3C72_2129880 [compost metagenome]